MAKKPASAKKAPENRPQPAKPVAARTATTDQFEMSPEKVLDIIQSLEELTSKVKNAETELGRTLELQTDLGANLTKQRKEKEVLEAKTAQMTGERDALAADLAKLETAGANLVKELGLVSKIVEKNEVVKKELAEELAGLTSKLQSLLAVNTELKDRDKKVNVDIEKLAKQRKDMTT
jgi:chromosome segregation ATPase